MISLLDKQIVQGYKDFDGTGDLLRRLVQYFEDLTPQRIQAAHVEVETGDLPKLKSELHKIKNSFLNVGAVQIANDCQSIEDSADSLRKEEIDSMITALSEQHRLALIELKQYL